MPKKLPWKKVASNRNSECGSARLESLDWSNWWTDRSGADTYLHVAHKEDGTIHRVHCRHATACRVAMRNGILSWIIDAP